MEAFAYVVCLSESQIYVACCAAEVGSLLSPRAHTSIIHLLSSSPVFEAVIPASSDTSVLHSVTGDERPGRAPADMVFIIDEKPHPRFQREGDNLVINRRLSLAEALCGIEFQVQTLDNRVLTISTKDEVITPQTTKIIRYGIQSLSCGIRAAWNGESQAAVDSVASVSASGLASHTPQYMGQIDQCVGCGDS